MSDSIHFTARNDTNDQGEITLRMSLALACEIGLFEFLHERGFEIIQREPDRIIGGDA